MVIRNKVKKSAMDFDVMKSRLIDDVTKASMKIEKPLDELVKGYENLVRTAKSALETAKSREGSDPLEIQWLEGAVRTYERNMNKLYTLSGEL